MLNEHVETVPVLLDPDAAISLAMAELELLRVQTAATIWQTPVENDLAIRDLSPLGR